MSARLPQVATATVSAVSKQGLGAERPLWSAARGSGRSSSPSCSPGETDGRRATALLARRLSGEWRAPWRPPSDRSPASGLALGGRNDSRGTTRRSSRSRIRSSSSHPRGTRPVAASASATAPGYLVERVLVAPTPVPSRRGDAPRRRRSGRNGPGWGPAPWRCNRRGRLARTGRRVPNPRRDQRSPMLAATESWPAPDELRSRGALELARPALASLAIASTSNTPNSSPPSRARTSRPRATAAAPPPRAASDRRPCGQRYR